MDHVEVVEERTPGWVVLEDGVGEADQGVAVLDQDRATPGVWLLQPVAPDRPAVGDYVVVEEGVGVGAPVVPAPAVGMQGGDRPGIGWDGRSEPEVVETRQAKSSSSILALAPCRSRVPDRHRARSLGSSG